MSLMFCLIICSCLIALILFSLFSSDFFAVLCPISNLLYTACSCPVPVAFACSPQVYICACSSCLFPSGLSLYLFLMLVSVMYGPVPVPPACFCHVYPCACSTCLFPSGLCLFLLLVPLRFIPVPVPPACFCHV